MLEKLNVFEKLSRNSGQYYVNFSERKDNNIMSSMGGKPGLARKQWPKQLQAN